MASRPGALVYVKRNAKVVTNCALERYNGENTGVDGGEGDDEDADEESDEDGEHNSEDDSKDRQSQNMMDVGLDEMVEALCYKYVTLTLLPIPKGERDLLVMEIDLQFTKEHERNSKG